jgi:GNAT superfamily N-acetyltransferase
MHRVRLAVRENMLSSPSVISESDYIAFIEVKGRGWVIEVDGEVVAFAVGDASDGNIWALFVDPDYEGRGYGKRLNATMVEWLRGQGLRRLWLTTDPDSRAAGFYAAVGWRYVCMTESGEARFELDVA